MKDINFLNYCLVTEKRDKKIKVVKLRQQCDSGNPIHYRVIVIFRLLIP